MSDSGTRVRRSTATAVRVQGDPRHPPNPMPRRHRNRLTIRRAMGLIAVTGVILGLLVAANRGDDEGFVAACLIASLVVVVPVHFAIEANRRDARDALNAGQHRAGDPDQEGSPGPV